MDSLQAKYEEKRERIRELKEKIARKEKQKGQKRKTSLSEAEKCKPKPKKLKKSVPQPPLSTPSNVHRQSLLARARNGVKPDTLKRPAPSPLERAAALRRKQQQLIKKIEQKEAEQKKKLLRQQMKKMKKLQQKEPQINRHKGSQSRASKVAELAGIRALIRAKERQNMSSSTESNSSSDDESRRQQNRSNVSSSSSSSSSRQPQTSNSRSVKSPKKKVRQICNFWKEGKCTAGPSCRFLHCENCPTCGQPGDRDEEKRKEHAIRCLEIKTSKKLLCGLCRNMVLGNGLDDHRFGILVNCEHVFCNACIADYRRDFTANDDRDRRECPKCGTLSNVVVPYNWMVIDERRKQKIISVYKENLRKIPCRRHNNGAGTCPYGENCLYDHGKQETIKKNWGWGIGSKDDKDKEIEQQILDMGFDYRLGYSKSSEDQRIPRNRAGLGYIDHGNTNDEVDTQMFLKPGLTITSSMEDNEKTQFLPLLGQSHSQKSPWSAGKGRYRKRKRRQSIMSYHEVKFVGETKMFQHTNDEYDARAYVADEEFASFEKHTNQFGTKMLNRMGFKGRLGKKQSGIVNPITLLYDMRRY